MGGPKTPKVKGLQENESIGWHFEWKNKEGFLKKEKRILCITNHRLLDVRKDDGEIVKQYDISSVSAIAKNVKLDQQGSDRGNYGELDFFYMGEGRIYQSWGVKDPNNVVRIVDTFKSNRTKKDPSDVITIEKSIPSSTKPLESLEDPIKILKLRFVKGEISKEEFEETKRMLE